MGFKSLVLILIFAILSASCSAINFATQPDFTKRDYGMFNYLGSKHNSKIIFLNGDEIDAEYVFVKNDSLYYVAIQDTLSNPLTDIEKVEISQLGIKIATGIFMGTITFFVSGFSAGAIYSAIHGDSLSVLFIGIIVGSLLGLAALVLGTIYYGESGYIFNEVHDKKDENHEKGINNIDEEVRLRQMENYKKQIKYFEEKAKRDSTNLGN